MRGSFPGLGSDNGSGSKVTVEDSTPANIRSLDQALTGTSYSFQQMPRELGSVFNVED